MLIFVKFLSFPDKKGFKAVFFDGTLLLLQNSSKVQKVQNLKNIKSCEKLKKLSQNKQSQNLQARFIFHLNSSPPLVESLV